MQELSQFSLSDSFRGKSRWVFQAWKIVQSSLFRYSPWLANGFRCWLLRCFGAKMGNKVVMRPTVKIEYPWKISIGDYSWIGDDVVLYSLDTIHIGRNSVISQKSFICAGGHDYLSDSFLAFGKPISISDKVWIAADVFVAPGVSIGAGTVVGARSSVFNDLPANTVCMGTPCRPVKERIPKQADIEA